MTRNCLVLMCACIMLLADAGPAAELKVETDKDNVVSSRLEGTWKGHAALMKRLKGKSKPRPDTFSFKSDPTVAAKIPEKHAKFLTERIYMAGYMKLGGKDLPFVVTSFRGNPQVVFWLERDGDPFGNGESFIVMLAVAKDKQNDLLFVGGDFNNEAFRVYERVKPEGKE